MLTVGGIELDVSRKTVKRDGSIIDLSRKEFSVLEVLMREAGSVVSAEHLLEKAWDENANPFTNSMRATISTLRRKIGAPNIIETVVGAAYRLNDPCAD